MNKGEIEQLDAPEALFERPRTRFVADFLAVKNLLEAEVVRVEGGAAELVTRGGNRLRAQDDGGYVAGAAVLVGVRPERLSLGAPDEIASASEAASAREGGAPTNTFAGRLDDEIYLGDWTDWRVRLGDEVVSVAEGQSTARHRKRGDAVTVRVPPEAILRLEDPGAARG
jgi:ABC-type Fe3+/spermidine/putrescine transport system ATPase subunit